MKQLRFPTQRRKDAKQPGMTRFTCATLRLCVRHFSVLFLFLVLNGRIQAAEPSAPDDNSETVTKVTFAPEVETKLADLLAKMRESKRKSWGERMKSEIKEVVKATGLDATGSEALEAASGPAIDRCLEGWSAKVSDLLRKQLSSCSPGQMQQMLDQMLGQADALAKSPWFDESDRPFNDPSWTGTLQHTLTPEQADAWNKLQTERFETMKKEIADFLTTSMESMREQYERTILSKSAEIKLMLNLPKERAEQLDALGKETAGKSADAWRKRAENNLLNMDDDQRRQILKNKQFFSLGSDMKELPERQPAWKDGLAKLLSAEELKQLQAAREERSSRRVRIMGRMMLVLLDEKIAFTSSQRQQLEPITERLARDQMRQVLGSAPEYGGVSPPVFFAAASKASEAELKPLLDSIQWGHWQEVCMPKNTAAVPAKSGTTATPSQQATEPEDLEREISDFLQEKTAVARKRILAEMNLKTEDVSRIAHLPANVIGMLQTAARGDAEESLTQWKSNIDQFVRSNLLREATAQNVKQQLARLEDFNLEAQFMNRRFPRNGRKTSESETIWDYAVKTELTAEQQTAWRKELDERSSYREKVITSAIMEAFERQNPITTAQREKLEPIIAGILKDYAQDIGTFFSSSNDIPWYLQSYNMFIPFSGVPEDEFKAILTKEQWDRWTGSNECSNVANYWENLKQIHESRVKAENQ